MEWRYRQIERDHDQGDCDFRMIEIGGFASWVLNASKEEVACANQEMKARRLEFDGTMETRHLAPYTSTIRDENTQTYTLHPATHIYKTPHVKLGFCVSPPLRHFHYLGIRRHDRPATQHF